MPAILAASVSAGLSLPLSRAGDAIVIPSSCQGCGVACGSDWVHSDGLGVLMHRTGEPCPSAVPFVWETGEPLSPCGDCAGSLVDVDSDGSMTGFTGSLIPCYCAHAGQDGGSGCGCFVEGWPMDDGFTGWVEEPEYVEGSPVYRPCLVHTPSRANTTALAVAA
ncbi:hypothetical protein [Streptomyces sp. NPDC001194]|uniref:hypothetical protein n=1 Tax=Streptomyces sp. NPDC001194 TaxID=3364547 RepID=UPI00367AD055